VFHITPISSIIGTMPNRFCRTRHGITLTLARMILLCRNWIETREIEIYSERLDQFKVGRHKLEAWWQPRCTGDPMSVTGGHSCRDRCVKMIELRRRRLRRETNDIFQRCADFLILFRCQFAISPKKIRAPVRVVCYVLSSEDCILQFGSYALCY